MKTRSAAAPIRAMDLKDLDTLPDKIDRLFAHHNALAAARSWPRSDEA